MSVNTDKTVAIYETWVKANPPASFSDVSRAHGVTRNVVAGAVTRLRKPEDGRVMMVTRGKKTETTSHGVWVDRTRPLGE